MTENKPTDNTPLKPGSASFGASGGADNDTFVDRLKHPLAVDVMEHQLFNTIDDILTCFLSFCKSSANEGPKKENLLEIVRSKVRSIYDDPELKGLVKAYCEVKGDERKRYPPFVKAFNLALSLLYKVVIPGLRGANSDLNIMFHVNDPAFITAAHNGVTSKRKPDVVLTSLAAAQRASKTSHAWEGLAINSGLSLSKPQEQLVWKDIFSSIEFKRTKASLAVPPNVYRSDFPAVEHMKDVTKLDPLEQFESKDAGRSAKRQKFDPDGKGHLAVPVSDPFIAPDGNLGTSISSGKRPSSDISEDLEADLREKFARAKISPAIQCGMYGAEMLCRAPAVNHAIDVLIIDDIAWIWWYDRTGAIQSEGINFVQDLPRFIVLLFAFQRFTLEDWGFNLIMDPEAKSRHTALQGVTGNVGRGKGDTSKSAAGTTDKGSDDEPFELKFLDSGVVVTVDPNKALYSSYALVGRATRVLGVRDCVSTRTKERLEEDLVVKISWPSQDRTSEFKILEEITKHAQADTTDDIKGHIPEALYSADFSNPSDNIRNPKFVAITSISAQKLSVRVLRATVFRRLEPITNLQSGEEFMKAWFQCVRCHYALWKCGVEHTDPSVGNLMTNPSDKNKGVLNDWDLAIIRVPNKESLPHSERTGTPPFMAIDLLSKAYYDGHMKRLYRHDLEGFIWILPWVFLQYEKGNRVSRVLRGWENSDYRDVRDKKSGFLSALSEVNIMEQFGNEWAIAYGLLAWLSEEQSRRTQAARKSSQSRNPANAMAGRLPSFIRQSAPNAEAALKEKEPKEVYSEFWNAVVDAIADNPALEYVYHCIPENI